MPKSLPIVLLALLFAGPAWSQENQVGGISEEPVPEVAAPGDEAGELETTDAEATVEADEIDDADLDEQTYEEDENDFVPSEEIPVDEPIPFPSNI